MSGFIDRFSKAVPAVETTYYDGLSANPHARSAVGNRNLAREKIRDGDVTGAKIFANISVKDLKKKSAPAREIYASLGMAARAMVLDGGCREDASEAVDEMEALEIGVEGMPGKVDAYEDTFRPVRSAARFCGDWKVRAKGVGIGVTGIATSPFVESERLRNFPSRNKSLHWRIAKKLGFAGKNACAVAANVLSSEHLAKLACK